jgi:serine/threonine protein kinase
VEDEHLSSAGYVVVKVADFGTSTENREGVMSENLDRCLGTTRYRAPEVPMPRENIESVQMRNSNVIDVYSFGIVCYEILSGKQPFEDCHLAVLTKQVRAGLRPRLPAICPRILASLIERCWASDPNSRPDFERICLELRHIKTMLITSRSYSVNFQ